MQGTVLSQKAALRKLCLEKRLSVSEEERAQSDAALCRAIAAHPFFLQADLLLSFCAVRGEPDFSPLCALARDRGIKTAFPRCEGKEMQFYTVESDAELECGRFAILTPKKSAPLAIPSARTLCLLPALAASEDGARLGYGGGFYDRFLQGFCGHTLLAIYDTLIFPTLPCEQTDVRAEVILTEKGVLYPHA